MRFQFELNESQSKNANAFMKAHAQDVGAIGGQFEFRFTPNSIGCACSVIDLVSHDVFELTDYKSW